ncbi:MAG: HK97 gp10 family phage protein [Caulobacter sp.]
MARRARPTVSVRRPGDTKVEGLEAMSRRVDALPAALRTQLKAALMRGANSWVGTMKAIAPRVEGDLLGSIAVEAGVHDLSVVVVAGNAETPGKHVEYGHLAADGSHVEAKPFYWPAYRVNKKRIVSGLNRAGNAAIKQVMSSGADKS